MSMCNIYRILLIPPSGKYCLHIFLLTAWIFLRKSRNSFEISSHNLNINPENLDSMKHLFIFDHNVTIFHILDRYYSNFFSNHFRITFVPKFVLLFDVKVKKIRSRYVFLWYANIFHHLFNIYRTQYRIISASSNAQITMFIFTNSEAAVYN